MNEEYNKLMLYRPKEDVVKDYLILEHNWNELKKYVEDRIDTWDTAEIMLSKMQELEGVSNE